jgi:hypothetical protein
MAGKLSKKVEIKIENTFPALKKSASVSKWFAHLFRKPRHVNINFGQKKEKKNFLINLFLSWTRLWNTNEMEENVISAKVPAPITDTIKLLTVY